MLGLRFLSARRRITLHGITGRPLRAALTVLGVALAVPIILVSRFWNDALDYMMNVQFAAVDRGDIMVTFTGTVSATAQCEIARLPGVLLTEGFRAVPVRLVAAHRTYRTAILGLPHHPELRRPLDRSLRPIALPPEPSCCRSAWPSGCMSARASTSSWRCWKANGRSARFRSPAWRTT